MALASSKAANSRLAADMLSMDEVCRFFGGDAKPLHKSTINRWVREGRLAPPIHLGPRIRRWKRADCEKAKALAEQGMP